uniref:Uncharacterized protein n=1 Tax=Ditylenchus dipsaci TaxID=166011 RepID=A0A915ECH2_9BILA
MYSTLMDLLNWPSPDLLTTSHEATKSRSLSIFRPIPLNRTCNDAGIEPHWCTCLSWQSAMTAASKGNSTGKEDLYTSNRLAKAVVQVINEQTQPERKLCARLTLDKLIDAKKLVPNDKLLKYSGIEDYDGFAPKLGGHVQATKATYQLVFTTKPGNAKYEATVLYDASNPSSLTVTVDLAAISHINAYGTTPHCIVDKNFFLATYCVCYDRI